MCQPGSSEEECVCVRVCHRLWIRPVWVANCLPPRTHRCRRLLLWCLRLKACCAKQALQQLYELTLLSLVTLNKPYASHNDIAWFLTYSAKRKTLQTVCLPVCGTHHGSFVFGGF
eukprot:6387582-Amphidinium_carterae.1